ncbi:hypothetical protein [Flavobacterium sp. F52]|nr:hypothetical protein [Flavobacterium sp. F52]
MNTESEISKGFSAILLFVFRKKRNLKTIFSREKLIRINKTPF